MVEQHNNTFFYLVEHKQPSIGKFVKTIKKDEVAVCSLMEQDVHGDPPRKRVRPPARPKRRSGSVNE